MIRRFLLSFAAVAFFYVTAMGADPTATEYSAVQCQGSALPYPAPASPRVIPDSLTPVFLNHVGRHGARFYSSSKFTTSTLRMLDRADSLKTITPAGKELRELCRRIVTLTAGRWGALDSLGMAEQRAIASRTFATFPSLFDGTKIFALSSYVPRCVASMYEFTHQLTRLNNRVELYSSSGRQNNALMRPWTDDSDYKAYMASDEWHKVYEDWVDKNASCKIAPRLLGESFPISDGESRDFAINLYKIVAGCASIGLAFDSSKFLTLEEYNSLWSIENLHHYLTHSASTLSQAPMELASRLLFNLIQTMQKAADGQAEYSVELRFGHAETLMPLLALMRLKGCYYMTNYFDTVGLHWKDFYVVPMASNLQISLLRSDKGNLYVRVDLNENPLPLLPGSDEIYTPWGKAREYLTRCLPLIMQE